MGRIEQLKVPRDRDGTFTTYVFEEHHRATGEVEDAVLEMWLQGISQRRVEEVTRKLGAVKIGKAAVSRIAQRLEGRRRTIELTPARPGLPRAVATGGAYPTGPTGLRSFPAQGGTQPFRPRQSACRSHAYDRPNDRRGHVSPHGSYHCGFVA